MRAVAPSKEIAARKNTAVKERGKSRATDSRRYYRLTRSNGFAAKSKNFAQTLLVVVSRLGPDWHSPQKRQRRGLLSRRLGGRELGVARKTIHPSSTSANHHGRWTL